jgi:NtrC-family two-component system response regulator AlgB
VVPVRLPPLRERSQDLPALVDHLLASLAARHQRPLPRVEPEARAALGAYAWPGNVRELANALERALVLSPGGAITAESLPDAVLAPPGAAEAEPAPTAELSLEEVERRHVRRVLASSATLEEAAARLGIDPTTLWRKRKRWGLD